MKTRSQAKRTLLYILHNEPVKWPMTSVEKAFYESPLKHIKESKKKRGFRSSSKDICNERENDKKGSCSYSSLDTHNDSVVILSDSDIEQYSQQKEIASCKVRNNNSDSQPCRELRKSLRCSRNSMKISSTNESLERKRKSVIIDNSDTSCYLLSDTEDTQSQVILLDVDHENIEPQKESLNQMSDDVTVIWSSMQTPVTNNQVSDISNDKEKDLQQETDERLFMIDHRANFENLKYLKDDFEPPLKKQKVLATSDGSSNFTNDYLPFSKPSNLALPLGEDASKKSTDVSHTISDVPANEESNMKTSHHKLKPPGSLREIIVDGNNVAMAYGKNKAFSETGIKLIVDYFESRGHKVKVFVPHYRRSLRHPILELLYAKGIVIFTPSRKIGRRHIISYDDRFILEYATLCEGIVISLDQYRDLYEEKPEWRDTIATRLLMPTFVDDYIMFPEDPLGRSGPRLNAFLQH